MADTPDPGATAPDGNTPASGSPEPTEPNPNTAPADDESSDTGDAVEEALPASFDDFELTPALREAVRNQGWTEPTPVQTHTFGPIRAGQDVLVESHTGSGKTGAFCLPWLAGRFEPGDPKQTGVQLLVLTPTRELAKQVAAELSRLAVESPVSTLTLYGGTPMRPQLDALRQGVHAVVGTPGRILDHIRRRSLDLSKVRMVVLDEADEMLSMGFLEDIRAILEACAGNRQTALFSATIPSEIARISKRYMNDPVPIRLSGDQASAAEIRHTYYTVSGTLKTRDLLDIINLEEPTTAIVFCNTREETHFVAGALQREGLAAEMISSDLTQSAREQVMERMRAGRIRFLVATDVAARGIDVSHVSHVFNYSFPENSEGYIHRTGRTGRAGRPGTAVAVISPQDLGNFYELKLQYPSIEFTEQSLPAQDELESQRLEVKLDRISRQYPDRVPPEWTLLARQLMADPRGERVFAALLSRANRPAPPSPLSGGDDEPRPREHGRDRGRKRRRTRGRHRDREEDDSDDSKVATEASTPAHAEQARPDTPPEPRADGAGPPSEASKGAEATARENATEAKTDGTETAAPAQARDDGSPSQSKKRKRRRRRKRGKASDKASDKAEASTTPAGADASGEATTDPVGQSSGEVADKPQADPQEPTSARGDDETPPEGGQRRRRRRRRRRKRGGGGGSSEPEAPSQQQATRPVASQDQIVLDIDEQELDVVRGEFGEIDELDELTLKARRRAVIDVLQDEVELEDLSERDRETSPSADTDSDSDSDTDGETQGEQDEDISDDGDDDSTSPSAEAAQSSQTDEAPAPDKDGDDAGKSGSSSKQKRKRRRRRRKKKPEPETPELMVPPHKDFWEAWSSRFSYAEFEDESYYERVGIPDEVEDKNHPTPSSEGARNDQPDRSASPKPATEPTGEWIRIHLNVGRGHGKKAAHVRGLLEERLGLAGKDIRDLTVREASTVFRVDRAEHPRIVETLHGHTFDGIDLLVGLPDEPAEANDATGGDGQTDAASSQASSEAGDGENDDTVAPSTTAESAQPSS